MQLLAIPEGKSLYMLDIGCGSGVSGHVLEENGHEWVGIDISQAMLDVAVDREVEGDVYRGDIGQGFGFRPGTFDAVVSISAIQWLCHSEKKSHVPKKRIKKFFQDLLACCVKGARIVF